MNQPELYKWFCQRRQSGDHSYYSLKDIEKLLKENYLSLKIRTLYAWGYLEVEDSTRWKVRYRIKKFYMDKENRILSSPLSKDISMAEYRERAR